MPSDSALINAMIAAIDEAKKHVGATAPNPPVGAAAIDSRGEILAVSAHQRAGTPHAEALLLTELTKQNLLNRAHTILVTLEPCNHHGRTPPCADALIQAGIKNIVFGARDPHIRHTGGAQKLKEAGVSVKEGLLLDQCRELIAPFHKLVTTGHPWVTIKQALRLGSMIPPTGQKTFTNPASLKLAHELRRRADAILTGSGTILSDFPLFTVRHVPDTPQKNRWLVVLDRRGQVPDNYYREARQRGFLLPPREVASASLTEAIRFLGEQGCLEVLIEAGPTLTEYVLNSGLWDQHVVIEHTPGSGEEPITMRSNNSVHGNH